MKHRLRSSCIAVNLLVLVIISVAFADQRVPVTSVGIPLADHYAGIVAYEKYRDQMKFADFRLKLLPGPALVQAYFSSKPDVDMAFNVCPMVMDMFAYKPIFRLISLIHRDGNALTINNLFNDEVDLPQDKRSRLPGKEIAEAIKNYKMESGEAVRIGIPSTLATHAAILYKYFRDNDLTFGFRRGENVDVLLELVNPPQSPVYLNEQNSRGRLSATEQSLPWPEEAETAHTGSIAWYSKDVLPNKHGHVECVIIAKDQSIREKRAALQEVIRYIHQAGQDIEAARRTGGDELEKIVVMIRKQVPAHSREAIIQSLRSDLNVINYDNLNVDVNAKTSLKDIMTLAYEAGFMKQKINIDLLVDDSFNTQVIEQ